MKTNRINKDLLNGNISEQILILTMPIFGSHVLQQVYQFVDSIVLGRYAGVEAMAAVGGSSTMLINILVNAIGGLSLPQEKSWNIWLDIRKMAQML